MEFNNYKALAMRTRNNDQTFQEGLLNICLGLAGEYSEYLVCITPDRTKDELSDLYWYSAYLFTLLDRDGFNDWVDITDKWEAHLDICDYLLCNIGKLCDTVKKSYFQGHPLDLVDLSITSDLILSSLNKLATQRGFTPSEIMEYNVEKLKRRFPIGFKIEDSINREV